METTETSEVKTIEQIETLAAIANIVKNRKEKIFTTKEVFEELKKINPDINYYAVIARLKRLAKQGIIARITRRVYIVKSIDLVEFSQTIYSELRIHSSA